MNTKLRHEVVELPRQAAVSLLEYYPVIMEHVKKPG
jgi:hypothetical protein